MTRIDHDEHRDHNRDPFKRGYRGQLLGRFHRRQLAARDAQVRSQALLESGSAAPEEHRRKVTLELADPQDLRGIPVVGRGIGGTSPGSNPLGRLISRESRAERGDDDDD